MGRAIEIMESLRRLPLARGTKQAGEVAYEIARRLAAGRPEDELRERLDAPLPPEPVVSVAALLRRRLRDVPIRPPGQANVRQEHRSADELQDKLAQEGVELYARTGERAGAVDPAKIQGGWRELVRRQSEAT